MEPHATTVCRLRMFGMTAGRSNGLYSMCVIAVTRLVLSLGPVSPLCIELYHRLIAVKFPLLLRKLDVHSRWKVFGQVAFVWAVVICMSCPYLYYANTREYRYLLTTL